MTSTGRRPTLPLRLALLVAPPLLILAGAWWPLASVPAGRTEATSAAIRAAFGDLVSEVMAVGVRARDAGATDGWRRWMPPKLASRLEGIGRLQPDGSFETWEGTPAEPGPPFPARDRDGRWWIRIDGVWARMVVRTGADRSGRRGTATFLLGSSTGAAPASDLLPARITSRAQLQWSFEENAERSISDLPDDAWRELVLGDDEVPSGLRVRFREIPPDGQLIRRRGQAAAWAAVVFCLLLVVLFPWSDLSRKTPGLALVLTGIAVGRAALVVGRVPSRLLPHELGQATLFGAASPGGVLGSPADLLLTVLALVLASLAISAALREASRRYPRSCLAAGSTWSLFTTVFLGYLARLLARDASAPLLELEGLLRSAGRAALLSSLLLAAVAAVEGLAASWVALCRARAKPTDGRARPVAALALLPLGLLAGSVLQVTTDRMALARLRSEFAPQVLEQSARRRLSLLTAVRDAALSPRTVEALLAPQTAFPSGAAYRLWISSDLFHAGFRSSLDLYDELGFPRSHFGFDLPPLAEDPPRDDGFKLSEREESVPIGAVSQRLLHAEMPVLRGGVRLGAVVGHVLEDPSNLPFLPGASAYLSALGPGAPRAALDDPSGKPAYVLYDASGRVLFSTLDPPPEASTIPLRRAERGEVVQVRAGAETFVAIPLKAPDRLHLLALPARTLLDRLGEFVRLLLVGYAWFAAIELLRSGTRLGGLRGLLRALAASYHRKWVATLLLTSILPVIGLSLFLRGYIERRAEAGLGDAAKRLVTAARRVVEDVALLGSSQGSPAADGINDEILSWLKGVVGQEILLYEDGRLTATSKRELFASGLLLPRLPGDVERHLFQGGLQTVLRKERIGAMSIPVAYGRADLSGVSRRAVVAIPLVLQQQAVSRAVDRVEGMLLLATVLLGSLLVLSAAVLARSVARPVRELAAATNRIASGDYGQRLTPRSRDEVADLVSGFNAMAAALAAQREDLEQRKDYMEALLTHATTGVISTDADGRIVTANPSALELMGTGDPRPEVGSLLLEVVARSQDLAPLQRALSRPAPRDGHPEEVDLIRAGNAMRLRLVRVPLPDARQQAPGMLILVEDVTDLMRSNQLAAWAEMARAIAHEIKNPLTPIQLSTEHLERLLRDRGILPAAEVEACLSTVLKQVRSLREIASEFSSYAKLPALVREILDPVALLRDAVAPYRASHPSGVVFEEDYRPCPAVAADRRVLSRAIVNLVENALQAIPEGGTIVVRSTPLESEAAPTRVALIVEDSGPGIDPEVASRLFEPYFSTKSSGTGLGLALVRRAVEAHGGSIDVGPGPGGGTRFAIVLPAC